MHLLTSTDDTGHGARNQADIVELLVDARVGILGLVEEARPEAGAPNFFHFRGRAANTAAFTRQTNFARSAGASVRREVAASKAIGEAIERYCAAIFDVEELPLVAYREAPFPCIAPHEFALYSREQYDSPDFPWSPFDKDTRIRWTAATDLATGVPCYVPASRVYMPYLYYIDTGDVPIDQPISTGLACQMSSAEAIRAAISEVVERDAFLITWQAMLAPPRIRLETLSVANRDLVGRFECTCSSVVIFDITLDHGIPTILSVLLGNSLGAAAMVVAASTALDPEHAVRCSLEELALTRLSSQYLKSHARRIEPDLDRTDRLKAAKNFQYSRLVLSVANGFNRVASLGLDLIGDSLQVFRRTPGHGDGKPLARKTPGYCCAGAAAGADTNDPDNVARICASSMSSGHLISLLY